MDRIEALLRAWTGEHVLVRYDAASGAWIFIAIHSTKLGPASGGTRMKSYDAPADALRDALRLAEGMTYKFAAAGLRKGGGKAVIAIPEMLDGTARNGLLRRYGRLIANLRGGFSTGPDMGTGPAEMDVIAEETTEIFGKSERNGGAGDPGPFTALGVYAAIRASCRHVFGDDDLSRRSVAIQGVGSVGGRLARRLIDDGAAVRFCDTDATRVAAFEGEGLVSVPPEAIFDQEVDVLAPCAGGAILNGATIPRLRCRVVAGGANNQLETPEDGERLKERGILYAPDYVANAGGAIYLLGREAAGDSRATVEARILDLGRVLEAIFCRADAERISTDRAARLLAEERLG